MFWGCLFNTLHMSVEEKMPLELELSSHHVVGKEVFTVTREQQRAGVCQNYNT